MRKILVILGVFLSVSAPAWADKVAADKCAAGLAPTGKALYDAALPKVLAGATPRDALTGAARSMVISMPALSLQTPQRSAKAWARVKSAYLEGERFPFC